jgi:hypothetical protein
VLVLNAAGPQPEAPLTEMARAGHLAQPDFFVKSPVLPGRAVLPRMQARGTAASCIPAPGSLTGRRRAGRPMPPRRSGGDRRRVAPWAERATVWLREVAAFFMHAPANAGALPLACRFRNDVQALVPRAATLPDRVTVGPPALS